MSKEPESQEPTLRDLIDAADQEAAEEREVETALTKAADDLADAVKALEASNPSSAGRFGEMSIRLRNARDHLIHPTPLTLEEMNSLLDQAKPFLEEAKPFLPAAEEEE